MPSSAGQTSALDRKSTRLNSSHGSTSYAVFCLKKKKPTSGPRARRPAPLAPDALVQLGPAAPAPSPRGGREQGAAAGERPGSSGFFFFNDTATTEIYTLSLHDALPI